MFGKSRFWMILPLLGAIALLGRPATAAEPFVMTKMQPSRAVPSITVDLTGAPDLASYAAQARARCEAYYPQFVKYLASDGYTAPTSFQFIFREMDGVAYASGREVHFSAKFFRENPRDYGAALHEMVHVIQRYRGDNPGWLVEGVADYVRFYMYEPVSARPNPDPDKTHYRNAYRETAAFLAYVTDKHQPRIVPVLNAAMREGRYNPEIWRQETGKTIDELFTLYIADLRARRAAK